METCSHTALTTPATANTRCKSKICAPANSSRKKVERVNALAWATDNKTFFYVTEDAVTKRSDKFFRHVLGTDKTDLVYEEKDETV